ncbi:MAG TPA: NIPSNAP family protein [Methylomirabilota bacterium]|nr:NIPSNAP family protein [Methylomirabilota bacterium]
MNSWLTLSAVVFCAGVTLVIAAETKDTRCYEMRVYYAPPGKLDDLNKRFREHTLRLFEKHGIENIGYWMPIANPESKLIYVLRYPSREARDKSWKDFFADADWKAAAKASEANGKLVSKVESFFMQATDYSPPIKASKSGPRVFELRDYTASAGNLGALDARFRDHTVKLFAKHGMEHVAYWHLTPGQKEADRRLIYIIAHQSPEAGAASFDAFRKGPDWIKARSDSEKKAGGSLTEGGMAGVKSTYMRATDYSPMK